MCKMCVVSKILGTCAKCAREVYICNMCAVCTQSSRYVQNMRSLRTILKICAKYAQFVHNPQDMCKICAVCAQPSRYSMCKICAVCAQKRKRKKSSASVAGHPSKHWASPMFKNQCFQCGMVSDTYSYSRRPFICAATLPKVSVLIVCNGNSSMSWVKRSGSFKYN